MGNECGKCNCNNLLDEVMETETRVNNKMLNFQNKLTEPVNDTPMTMPSTNKSMIPATEELDPEKLRKIIMIQAAWRGFYHRRLFAQHRALSKSSLAYFTSEEIAETSKDKQFDQKLQVELRSPVVYKSGAVYTGEWRGGLRWGKGKIVYTDGTSYEGDWQYGRPHGKGKLIDSDKGEYEGEWNEGKKCGAGTYKYSDGAVYTGQWQDDIQHGQGKECWEDGTSYVGSYWKGKKHGRGTYTWSKGCEYSGTWKNDNIDGRGVHRWADGRVYYGDWCDNKMDGFGIQKWKGNNLYIGFYSKDKKHGYGTYYWNDGREFHGWWDNNQQLGLGKYITAEGTVMHGLWERGKRLAWFTAAETAQIKDGKLDYCKMFKTTYGRCIPPPNSNFEPPDSYEEQLHSVIQEFSSCLDPTIDIKKLINK